MANDIKEMYRKARIAFATAERWSQDRVDEIVAAVGWMWQKREVAEELAGIAVEESGMGVYEHKAAKQIKKTRGAMWDLRGS